MASQLGIGYGRRWIPASLIFAGCAIAASTVFAVVRLSSDDCITVEETRVVDDHTQTTRREVCD